jgi:hypothetical protein
MKIINAKFERFRNIPIDILLHAYGIYVLWDGNSKARPSYIGEGDIWARLESHREKFARPISGYIAILGEDYSALTKQHCQILESSLMECADETDRGPNKNLKGGNLSTIETIFRSHGVLKIAVSGYDPLQPPSEAKIMARTKTILYRKHQGEIFLEKNPWRSRKTRS